MSGPTSVHLGVNVGSLPDEDPLLFRIPVYRNRAKCHPKLTVTLSRGGCVGVQGFMGIRLTWQCAIRKRVESRLL